MKKNRCPNFEPIPTLKLCHYYAFKTLSFVGFLILIILYIMNELNMFSQQLLRNMLALLIDLTLLLTFFSMFLLFLSLFTISMGWLMKQPSWFCLLIIMCLVGYAGFYTSLIFWLACFIIVSVLIYIAWRLG